MRLACMFIFGLVATSLSAQPFSPRVVSLSPNLTELIFALGLDAHLVGRSSACDQPLEANTIPVVGDFGRPNLEALLKVKPDIVVLTDLERPAVRAQLERQGANVVTLPCESWDGLREAATMLGDLLDQTWATQRWIDALDHRLAALDEQVAVYWQDRERPKVYVEVWGSPLTTAGRDSFLHNVIERAGGAHVGGELDGTYLNISMEWVMRANPDVMLLAYMLEGMRPGEQIKRRIGWTQLRALKHARVIDDIPPDLLLRPGPRLIDGAEQLATRLQSLFPPPPDQSPHF